jgi:hypothetical protein
MKDIKLANGVLLKAIPISPNDDYMAGSDGQIYSRTRYAGFGKKYYVDWYPLKGAINSRGYWSVSLCHENKRVTQTVHRLICMAFHGMPPFKSAQVRHLNGTRTNALPENLKWGTQEENWMDRKIHGRGMEGEKHFASKFTDFERKAIKWAIEHELVSQHRTSRILGVNQSTIYFIVHNKYNSLEDKK